MKKLEMIYEGKAKKVYQTDNPELFIVDYKDDATAFNGQKKGTISEKGIINNRVTNHLMRLLEKSGIPTHLVEEISDRETIVKKVSIVPLEVIVRISRRVACKRLGTFRRTKLPHRMDFSIQDERTAIPWSTKTISLPLSGRQEEIDLDRLYLLKSSGPVASLKDLNIDSST
jgi:phosphoribosylaminoimidazole-succinocarboxamide synthase